MFNAHVSMSSCLHSMLENVASPKLDFVARDNSWNGDTEKEIIGHTQEPKQIETINQPVASSKMTKLKGLRHHCC